MAGSPEVDDVWVTQPQQLCVGWVNTIDHVDQLTNCSQIWHPLCHLLPFFLLQTVIIFDKNKASQKYKYYERILTKFYILCKIILKRQCPNCGELLLCFSFCLLRYSYIEALLLPCFNDFAAHLWIRVHKYKERQLSSLIGLAL